MSVEVPLKASERTKTNSGKKTKQNRYREINLSCIHYLNVLFHLLPVFFCFSDEKSQTLPVMRRWRHARERYARSQLKFPTRGFGFRWIADFNLSVPPARSVIVSSASDSSPLCKRSFSSYWNGWSLNWSQWLIKYIQKDCLSNAMFPIIKWNELFSGERDRSFRSFARNSQSSNDDTRWRQHLDDELLLEATCSPKNREERVRDDWWSSMNESRCCL